METVTGGISKRDASFFIACMKEQTKTEYAGELAESAAGRIGQAERKVCPSTREPDLDNANVGILRVNSTGNCQIGVSRIFYFQEVLIW